MLFRSDKIKNKLLKIAQEHEIVIKHLTTLRDILDKKETVESFRQLSKCLPTLTADMKHHFRIEERFIFPAAFLSMAEIEIVDLMTVLIKEHGYIERDLQILQCEFNLHGKKKQLPDPVVEILEKLIIDIEDHATNEMEILFPKMAENRHCRRLIEGISID